MFLDNRSFHATVCIVETQMEISKQSSVMKRTRKPFGHSFAVFQIRMSSTREEIVEMCSSGRIRYIVSQFIMNNGYQEGDARSSVIRKRDSAIMKKETIRCN